MIRHNHIAIWLMVALHQIITVIWYSPLLFSSIWISEQGRDMTKGTKDSLPFITGIFTSIILCYAISWLVHALHKTTWKQGIQLGLLLFFGFAVSTIAPHYKYLDLSNGVLLIDLGETFLIMVITSAILAVWRIGNEHS